MPCSTFSRMPHMTTLTEADVEAAALEWLAALGWQTAHGPDIGSDGPARGASQLRRRRAGAAAAGRPRAAGRRAGNCLTVGTTREEHDGAIGD